MDQLATQERRRNAFFDVRDWGTRIAQVTEALAGEVLARSVAISGTARFTYLDTQRAPRPPPDALH